MCDVTGKHPFQQTKQRGGIFDKKYTSIAIYNKRKKYLFLSIWYDKSKIFDFRITLLLPHPVFQLKKFSWWKIVEGKKILGTQEKILSLFSLSGKTLRSKLRFLIHIYCRTDSKWPTLFFSDVNADPRSKFYECS